MYVVGAYVSPNNQLTVYLMEQDLSRGPVGVDMLLVGYRNARLAQPRDQCEEDLATATKKYGIVDQTLHFIRRKRYIGKGV